MYEIPKELKTDISYWAFYSSAFPFLLLMLLLRLLLEVFFTGGTFRLKLAYYAGNVLLRFRFITKPALIYQFLS